MCKIYLILKKLSMEVELKMKYKVIDGVLYQVVNVNEIKGAINTLYDKVKPFVEGIGEAQKCINGYQQQIADYKKQVNTLLDTYPIDPEVVKAVDPEKAPFLSYLI